MKSKLFAISLFAMAIASCNSPEKKVETVLEVTSFNIKTTVSELEFNKLDAEIEETFTSKQPGFIRRQSGVDEQGRYVVLVYWKSLADAEASMNKFMSDESVANYAGMIDGSTMKMSCFRNSAKNKSDFYNELLSSMKPENKLLLRIGTQKRIQMQ